MIEMIKSKYKVKYYYIDGTSSEGTLSADPNKILHREGLPAIVSDYYPNEYWFNGKLHNMNGPAVIVKDKRYTSKWYFHGTLIKANNKEEFDLEIKKIIFS